MKCCEDVIVTLNIPAANQAIDMELPAFLPVEKLAGRVMETLQVMNPARYSKAGSLQFKFRGQVIADESTLASVGVWDGTVLDVNLM